MALVLVPNTRTSAVVNKSIIRLRKKLKIHTKNADLETSKEKLDEAYLQYKSLRVQHEELHKTYREKLAQARAEEGNTNV